MIQLLHATGKRARFRVPELYRSDALKEYLERSLSQCVGIEKVSANPLTGNVLIVFDANTTIDKITTQVKKSLSSFKNSEEQEIDNADSNDIESIQEWHLIESKIAIEKLESSETIGLTETLVEDHLQRYGANTVSEAETRSDLSIFLEQFQSLPVALLGVAAGISVITGGIADAIVIMGVVGLNAAIGYYTESQSERILHSLTRRANHTAIVLRDGEWLERDAEEIVVGDILMLKPGQYVAADARLLHADHLTIDESALTGESIPVTKTAAVLTQKMIPLADRVNMAYKGTLVTGGQGLAIVVATGKRTEMGQIQNLVSEATATDTPLSQQLDQVGSQLVAIASSVCALVFAIGLWRGNGLLPMLKTAISLAVAAVPEGLPTIATTILALGIQDMRQRHVLVRSLSAVEALGSIQTICLDKTGTITENRMSVVEIYCAIDTIKISQGQFFQAQTQLQPQELHILQKLLQVIALCNESLVELTANGDVIVNGSSTENALIELCLNAGVNIIELRQAFPLIATTQRSENRKFMTTIHQNQQKFVAVKGSPTEVLELCDRWLIDGEAVPLTDHDRQQIDLANDRMAGQALRVLAVAYQDLGADDDFNERNLIWVGLVGMTDPIRQGVVDLIAQFHQAGIDTVMITGDQSPTAYAIGKALNLSRTDHLEILDSTDLSQLPPEALTALANKVNVFARVSPANKLQIVQALQAVGKIVSMTGDGMNDAPALKSANVGVAMGHTGTDVAREVADIVLEDDKLETLIVAVSQGRTIYNNIRKAVHFLLATNLSEIMVEMIAIAAGLGSPLNAIQLLWLNLISDIFPGLALALEPPEPDILNQPPRDPNEPIIQTSDFGRIGFEAGMLSLSTLVAYSYGILRYGVSPRASTIAFMSLTSGQLLHALTCRSPHHHLIDFKQPLPNNPYLVSALGGSFALQLLAVSVPFLRQLLQIEPIDPIDAVVIVTSALLPLLINEATKTLFIAEEPQS